MMLVMALTFVLLNIGDAVSTYIGLKEFSLKEANPVIRYLIEKIGLLTALLLAKLISVSIVLYVLISSTLIWPIALVNAFYLVVVSNNFRLILKRKHERK